MPPTPKPAADEHDTRTSCKECEAVKAALSSAAAEIGVLREKIAELDKQTRPPLFEACRNAALGSYLLDRDELRALIASVETGYGQTLRDSDVHLILAAAERARGVARAHEEAERTGAVPRTPPPASPGTSAPAATEYIHVT